MTRTSMHQNTCLSVFLLLPCILLFQLSAQAQSPGGVPNGSYRWSDMSGDSAAYMLTAAANMPRSGDSLVVYAVSELPQTAGGGILDLTGTRVGRRSPFVHKVCSDTLTTTAFGTVSRFLIHGDKLELSGYENRRVLVEYDTPPPVLRWPVALGDSVGGSFEGRASWCGRIYARLEGRAWTAADRVGGLVLPSGDTLADVIRLRHVRETHHVTYDSINTWGMLRRTALNDKSPTCPRPVRTETAVFFAAGWRYPVLVEETTLDAGRGRVSAMLCLPAEQALADCGTDNALPGDSLFRDAGGGAGQTGDPPPFRVASLRYDAEGGTLHVVCEAAADTEVTLRVADASGMLWRENAGMARAGRPSTLRVDCSGLRRGQYALLVTCGAERQSFKFSIR